MSYTYENYAETREERRAFLPFYPDMRDISQIDEYVECVKEANYEYVECFKN